MKSKVYYLRQGGYVFTRVCLLVCLLSGLLKSRSSLNEITWNGWTYSRDQSVRLWMTVNVGSKSLFANNFVQNCRRESRQKNHIIAYSQECSPRGICLGSRRPRLRTLLPCLASASTSTSASTKLPWAHPCLFNSLNNSNYDYGRRTDSFKDR